jgi:hypothetical protein
MRVARYHEFGAPDVIEVEEIEPLEPRSEELQLYIYRLLILTPVMLFDGRGSGTMNSR